MRDEPLMCVTKIIDDETGIWANDLCEFSYRGNVKDFMKRHGKTAFNEILSMLKCLEECTKRDWEEIEKELDEGKINPSEQ